jgi:hypothetical protein
MWIFFNHILCTHTRALVLGCAARSLAAISGGEGETGPASRTARPNLQRPTFGNGQPQGALVGTAMLDFTLEAAPGADGAAGDSGAQSGAPMGGEGGADGAQALPPHVQQMLSSVLGQLGAGSMEGVRVVVHPQQQGGGLPGPPAEAQQV